MAKEARDPWTYYYYGRPKRDIMLPIRVTAAERAAIRAAAKWENKPVVDDELLVLIRRALHELDLEAPG